VNLRRAVGSLALGMKTLLRDRLTVCRFIVASGLSIPASQSASNPLRLSDRTGRASGRAYSARQTCERALPVFRLNHRWGSSTRRCAAGRWVEFFTEQEGHSGESSGSSYATVRPTWARSRSTRFPLRTLLLCRYKRSTHVAAWSGPDAEVG